MTLPTDGFGVYESKSPALGSSVWQPRLNQIAAGGFKLVMNYDMLRGHIADLIAYINGAASVGLHVIVALHDPTIWRDGTYGATYPSLYADAGSPGTGIAFMQYIVAQTKTLPGVWGWYVADEVALIDHATLKTYTDAILAADSTHPRLAIEVGTGVNNLNSFGTATTPMWDCCDVGGDDYYSIDVTTPTVDLSALATEVRGVESYCLTKGIGSAMVLQSHSLANYGHTYAPWPTEKQMLDMRNTVVNNASPRLVLWYSYFDDVSVTAPTNQFTFVSNASYNRSTVLTFPTALRRGMPYQNTYYPTTVLADTPLAYYRLGETSGFFALDATGSRAHTGILSTSGVTINQVGIIDTYAGSMLFDGLNGYITLPNALACSGASAISIEVWFKATKLPPTGIFANIFTGDSTSSNNKSFALYLFNNASLNLVVGNGTTNTLAQINQAVTVGIWYHAVGTYDGTTLRLYLNGALAGSQVNLSGTIGASSASPVVAANISHGSLFTGYLDELSVYTYALSATQILAHYRAGIVGSTTVGQRPLYAPFPTATRRQT